MGRGLFFGYGFTSANFRNPMAAFSGLALDVLPCWACSGGVGWP